MPSFKKPGLGGQENLLQMTTDWAKLQSQTIDLLRFPLAVAVVVSHYGMTIAHDAAGSMKYLRLASQLGARLAVPCFFFISGYLFFNQLQKWEWTIWKKKIRRRIQTLFIPYILWNLIAFVVYWLYAFFQGNGVPFFQQFSDYGGIKIFWGINGNVPIGPQSAPLNAPLWFIRDLIYYTIASPVIFFFVNRAKIFGVLFLCLVHVFFQKIVPEGLIFFTVGAFLQITDKNILSLIWTWRFFITLIFGVLLVTLYFFFDYKDFIELLFIFSGIGALFCVVASLVQKNKLTLNPFLVRSSFFIFATHEILILNNVSIPLVRFFFQQEGDIWDCLRFVMTPATAISICLILMFVMERCVPRTTGLLIGNRA